MTFGHTFGTIQDMNRSMLKNGRNPNAFSGHHMGCSCCNPKRVRRKGKKSAKRSEERAWRREERV